LKKHKEKPVIVVCKLGQHSSEAAKQLQEDGFSEVYRLSGGVTEWKAQSLPLIQQEQKPAKQKGGRKKVNNKQKTEQQ
jgi:rhodanese-related sulfurtransferase